MWIDKEMMFKKKVQRINEEICRGGFAKKFSQAWYERVKQNKKNFSI